MWTHPSYGVRLARRVAAEGTRFERYPSVVITFGGTLTWLDAATLARAFRCRVVDHYSSEEVHSIAQTCPDEPALFHVNSKRVVVHVVDENERAAASGERGWVLVTDLGNHVMPFVNDDTGDYAVVGPSCPCGRGFPTLRTIEGRSAQVIVTPDGRTLAQTTLGLILVNTPQALAHVWDYRAVQSPGGRGDSPRGTSRRLLRRGHRRTPTCSTRVNTRGRCGARLPD